MNAIKSMVKTILRKITRYRAVAKLPQLQAVNSMAANKIARSIRDTLDYKVSPEEKVWVERIEEVRRALAASSTEITVADYGAGSPNTNRTEKEMHDGVVITTTVASACKASKPSFWALLLFKLVREFKPATCIELGTCVGISAAYQAAAQKLNNVGRLTTLEGAASLAALSAKNLQKLGLDNAAVVSGRFQDNLEKVLNKNKPVDYAFIDGHHDERATVTYFEAFIPYLSRKSLVVFDDISWSRGMRRAWDTIVKHDKVKIAVDLGTIGICVLDSDRKDKVGFQIPLI